MSFQNKLINEYTEKEDYYELKIITTKNVEAITLIDKDDCEKIKKYKWTLSIHGDDIRVIASSKELKRIYLHQFIIGRSNRKNVIDHINRNPLDNRKKNLRLVSCSINATNAKPRQESKTLIRGVYKRKARKGIAHASWICEWSIEGKRFSKSFSITKYGEENAFRLACNLREEKLKEMKI